MPQQESSPRLAWLMTAVVAGVAGGLLAPLISPALARNARPTARKLLKAGIAAFERGRELTGELAEQASDLMAESRAEYDAEKKSISGDERLAASATEIVRLRGSGPKTAAT
jgi:hypothetical protein